MRKLLLTCFVIALLATQGFSQGFRFDLGAGYASPGGGGDGAKGGGVLFAEPMVKIKSIAVGLRAELAIVGRATVDSDGNLVGNGVEVKGSGALGLTGSYYLLDGPFKPFVGGGIGRFTTAAAGVSSTSVGTSVSVNKIGFSPRAGFDLGPITLMLEYNIIPATEADAEVGITTSGLAETVKTKNSYWSAKFAFGVGAGW